MPAKFEQYVAMVRDQGIEELTVAQIGALRKAGAPMVIIDIREEHEREKTHSIKGAAAIPRGLLEMNIERYARSPHDLIVLICSDGMRSVLAADSLKRMGYANPKALRGGFAALSAALERGQ